MENTDTPIQTEEPTTVVESVTEETPKTITDTPITNGEQTTTEETPVTNGEQVTTEETSVAECVEKKKKKKLYQQQ